MTEEEQQLLNEIKDQIRNEIRETFDSGDKKNGKSGYKGLFKIKLGNAYIQTANRLNNAAMKDALKNEGKALISKGRSDNHPTRR
jgi:hypothetical protein